jgi:death-on-curing protein
MSGTPRFLKLEEVVEFHAEEIRCSGGSAEIRDFKALESAVGAPKVSWGGKLLMDIFAMAATYAASIAFNHPFVDGNKMTAAAAALTFLYLNGYDIEESYDEELADKILDLVVKKISKDDIAAYFRKSGREI